MGDGGETTGINWSAGAATRTLWRRRVVSAKPRSRRRLSPPLPTIEPPATLDGVGDRRRVVGLLLLLALALGLRPAPKPPSELELAIEAMQITEKPTTAERLRAPLLELRLRREKLRDWQRDPEFNCAAHGFAEVHRQPFQRIGPIHRVGR